jgi:aminopeptidase N
LATFLQYLVQEKLEGKENAVSDAVARIRQRLRDDFADSPSAAEVPMIDFGEKQMTDLAYTKGMLFFYFLYEIMGEDPFLETVGAFYQKYAGSGATTVEFVDFFKANAEMDLDPLMEDWIFTAESSELIQSDMTVEEMLERY